jgi:hypothetical protein
VFQTRWLLCVVFLAACGSQGDPAAVVLRQNEVDWVRSYSLWSNQLYRDINRAEDLREGILGDGSKSDALGVAVRRLEGCVHRYRLNVGAPPTGRLREGARLALAACRDYARGERLQYDALTGAPSERLIDGDVAVSKADATFSDAERSLEAVFLWSKQLPRIGEATTRSRIEPLFSRVASSVANRTVEVRCWSPQDWKVVLAEYRAWDPGGVEPAGFVSDVDAGRANLDPWTCNHLVTLAYGHQRPRGDEAELDLAYAVQTLSHETQHLVAMYGTEAETECYGVQGLAQVARGLGASASYARFLKERFWADGYSDNDPEYKTKQCRNGGPLDAHPDSNVWP